jgi:hypothetical protein
MGDLNALARGLTGAQRRYLRQAMRSIVDALEWTPMNADSRAVPSKITSKETKYEPD